MYTLRSASGGIAAAVSRVRREHIVTTGDSQFSHIGTLV
jgi:hypothetical protein